MYDRMKGIVEGIQVDVNTGGVPGHLGECMEHVSDKNHIIMTRLFKVTKVQMFWFSENGSRASRWFESMLNVALSPK